MFVFFDGHNHMPNAGRNQPAQTAINSDQTESTQVKESDGVQGVFRATWEIDGGYGRYAIEPAQRCVAYAPLGACGGIDRTEKNQTHCEGNDAHVHIGEATIKHEVAQQQSKQARQGDGQEHGQGALAHIDHSQGIGVGTQAKKCGLPKAQNAREAPNKRLADGQDGHHHIDGDLNQGEVIHPFGNSQGSHHP